MNNNIPDQSSEAIARVPKPHLSPPLDCTYCHAPVELTTHFSVYGRNYSDWPYMYRCTNPSCAASVGVHPGTYIPLGTLADERLRALRTDAKVPFQKLWFTKNSSKINRSRAYNKLAHHLRIPTTKCHFGMFNEQQCRKAKTWAIKMLKSLNRSDEI